MLSHNPAPKPAPPPAGLTMGGGASGAPDPEWFSPLLYPSATVTKKGRTQADEQGRFTAQLLFALPSGATLADCVDPLTEKLAAVVPTLGREEKDGRVTMKGDSPDGYQVICVCGEAKGTMSAFVSYRWTSPPSAKPEVAKVGGA